MDAHEERGYLRLILAAASEDGPPSIPDDDDELAILSKLGSQWWKPTKDKEKRIGERTSGQKLRECWQFRPPANYSGRLYNEKLYEAWRKQKAFSEGKSAAGKKGNEKRWGERGVVAVRSHSDRNGIAPLDDGKGVVLLKEKDASIQIWEAAEDLIGKYPGTESLPGKPDQIIVSRCLEVSGWDLDVLAETLRKLFLSGKTPNQSWAWFPAVLPQYLENGK